MTVPLTLKLFATLGQYLPPGAERNKAQIEVAEGTTVSELIRELGLPLELTHLVLVNGVYIAPEERDGRAFEAGDEFAVFPPIAGGWNGE